MPTLHITIHVEGGIVQEVLSPIPLDFTIIDHDTEGLDPEHLARIPQLDGSTALIYHCSQSAAVAPVRIDSILKAIEAEQTAQLA